MDSAVGGIGVGEIALLHRRTAEIVARHGADLVQLADQKIGKRLLRLGCRLVDGLVGGLMGAALMRLMRGLVSLVSALMRTLMGRLMDGLRRWLRRCCFRCLGAKTTMLELE